MNLARKYSVNSMATEQERERERERIPYRLVWDSQYVSFCLFDRDWRGRTWPAFCRWYSERSPRDILAWCPYAICPANAMPISASPQLSRSAKPLEKEKKRLTHQVNWNAIEIHVQTVISMNYGPIIFKLTSQSIWGSTTSFKSFINCAWNNSSHVM